MIVSDTRYGKNKARKAAQDAANKAGRKAYLQMENIGHGRIEVLIATDGRGPIYLGMPWDEIYPEPSS